MVVNYSIPPMRSIWCRKDTFQVVTGLNRAVQLQPGPSIPKQERAFHKYCKMIQFSQDKKRFTGNEIKVNKSCEKLGKWTRVDKYKHNFIGRDKKRKDKKG